VGVAYHRDSGKLTQDGTGGFPLNKPDIEGAIDRIRELPTLPSVLGKILNTAADPDASALDLGQHITADQSLSATLLKLVNSAYYGFYRQVSSVTQAIVILGFLEVRNLVLTATAFRTLSSGSSDYDRLQLWRHSLASAMAAEHLAKLLKRDIEGTFEASLLHDIGKVVLDTLYPELFLQAAHNAHNSGRTIAECLKETFGMDHAEVGGLLGEHWNLPPTVVDAIRNHLAPENAERAPELTHLTAVANAITYAVGLGESSNGCALEPPTTSLAALKITPDMVAAVAKKLSENRAHIDEFLGALAS
jgi:putative nucleotidyltransferase with HDIG domain